MNFKFLDDSFLSEPMGAIIAVLATFDIHIEIKEVVPMNPARRSGGFVPTLFNTNNAIRL